MSEPYVYLKGGWKTVHVSGKNIGANASGADLPVIGVEQRAKTRWGRALRFIGPEGEPFATLVYDPTDPMHNSVRVWLDTRARLEVQESLWTAYQYKVLGADRPWRIYASRHHQALNRAAMEGNGDYVVHPCIAVQEGPDVRNVARFYTVSLFFPGLTRAVEIDNSLVIRTRCALELVQKPADVKYQPQAEEKEAKVA